MSEYTRLLSELVQVHNQLTRELDQVRNRWGYFYPDDAFPVLQAYMQRNKAILERHIKDF